MLIFINCITLLKICVCVAYAFYVTCLHTCVCTCAHVCLETRGQPQLFTSITCNLILEARSLTKPEAHWFGNGLVNGLQIVPFSTSPVLGPQTCAIMPSFAQRDLRLMVSIHYAWHANISWHYIYYLFSECVCVCLQAPSCHDKCVGVKEQLAEVSSLPLLCGSQWSNTGH